MRIAAVVVTYNRLGTLKRCIEAVLAQSRKPERVFVVDNNSTDGTRKWISELAESSQIRPVLLDNNYGGAGGFHHGIRSAYEFGADWIWTMDDDTIPNTDALEILVDRAVAVANHHSGEKIGFLASEAVWTDGTPHKMNVPGVNRYWSTVCPQLSGAVRIDAASFVSLLINREAVTLVGYPVKEFFIWMDDVEYTLRITRVINFPAYYIRESKVLHCTPTNVSGAEYADVSDENLWKYRYGTRNRVAFARSLPHGVFRGLVEMGFILKQMYNNRIPLRLQKSLWAAAVKGFFFNYKDRIVMPDKAPQIIGEDENS